MTIVANSWHGTFSEWEVWWVPASLMPTNSPYQPSIHSEKVGFCFAQVIFNSRLPGIKCWAFPLPHTSCGTLSLTASASRAEGDAQAFMGSRVPHVPPCLLKDVLYKASSVSDLAHTHSALASGQTFGSVLFSIISYLDYVTNFFYSNPIFYRYLM